MTTVSRQQHGFTLIELITTTVLISVISGILAPIINMAISSYADTEARVLLTSQGRLVIERIARELRHAVPNSISVINDGTTAEGIEFITSRTGGRYIAATDDFGTAFAVPSRRFEKSKNKTNLYLIAPGLNYQTNELLVIANASPNNLISGTTMVPVTAIANTQITPDGTVNGKIISFAAHQFPNDSPGKHIQIADYTHEIGMLNGSLRWHRANGATDYDMAQDWSATDPLLATGIDNIDFTYVAGTPQSSGTMRIELQLSKGKETIELYHEIQIRNTP
ncbi:MAG: hypothetical protein C0631_08575 [Sedimenticola sp.]|jgi:MSHA biogenesis protein MshO|nr:MAG: hypothetical protein C0631_08575 [Sedimenticola sp.]